MGLHQRWEDSLLHLFFLIMFNMEPLVPIKNKKEPHFQQQSHKENRLQMENPLSLEGKHHLLRRLQLWGKMLPTKTISQPKKTSITNKGYTCVECLFQQIADLFLNSAER